MMNNSKTKNYHPSSWHQPRIQVGPCQVNDTRIIFWVPVPHSNLTSQVLNIQISKKIIDLKEINLQVQGIWISENSLTVLVKLWYHFRRTILLLSGFPVALFLPFGRMNDNVVSYTSFKFQLVKFRIYFDANKLSIGSR